MNFIKFENILGDIDLDKFKPQITESKIKFITKNVISEILPNQSVFVEKFKKNKIFLRVNSSSLNQKIFWKKIEILKSLDRILGKGTVKDLRVRVKP